MRLALIAAAGTVLILPAGFTALLVWIAWKLCRDRLAKSRQRLLRQSPHDQAGPI